MSNQNIFDIMHEATSCIFSGEIIEKIKTAIENGADVNAKNEDGQTALDLAIEHKGDNKYEGVIAYLESLEIKQMQKDIKTLQENIEHLQECIKQMLAK